MPEMIFESIFGLESASVNGIGSFLFCLGSSLAFGFMIACSYMHKTRYTKSFLVTLALLPAVVAVVIMMVNGNVGAGVAVAGAFSLVRFRSVPGTAKEICMLFLAMSTGLITGMGYIGIAALYTGILCIVFLLYQQFDFGSKRNASAYKILTVTIPEDLDYTGIFDDLFEMYTVSHEMIYVKTTNMGSLFRLSYDITLRDPSKEKEMIDMIRKRNGNLEISISRQESCSAEL